MDKSKDNKEETQKLLTNVLSCIPDIDFGIIFSITYSLPCLLLVTECKDRLEAFDRMNKILK